jgi:hypothetical protein
MYLYFESENLSPFYIKIDEKVYTSVAPGYYVLPDLSEGRYKLTIGIPSASRLENRFEIDLKEKDRGLLIKTQGQNIILQDMQDGSSLNFIKDASLPEITYEPRNDAFTALLSKASGDPGLMMSPVFAKAAPKPENIEASVALKEVPVKDEVPEIKVETIPSKSDSVVAEVIPEKVGNKPVDEPKKGKITDTEPLIQRDTTSLAAENRVEKAVEKPIEKTEPAVAPVENYIKTAVRKFAEGSTSEGFSLVFIDDPDNIRDTIRIVIPNPKYNLVNTEVKERDQKFLELTEEKESKKELLPKDSVKGKAEASPVEVKEINPGKLSNPNTDSAISLNSIPKNSCKSVATQNDFFRLRKNMAAQVTDEEMVAEAKKSFKSRCFETEQIKNLSSLFLTSAGKYLFFDASYFHVSDPENFVTLQTEIKDDYYKKRFNALIGL